MGLYQQPDGTYVEAAEHFGYKAEHDARNQVDDATVDNLLFLDADFETEHDEECAGHMRATLLSMCAELDYENGNRYWLPDEIAPSVEEVVAAALADPEAPDGLAEWYEAH